MDLKRLEYFVAVVEAGGFSKAAAALHLSQSALSQQVAQLERETGHRLLTRNGRGAEATEVGFALLAHAKGIFSLADKARADLRERQKMPAGRITVGLPPRVAQALAGDLIESFRAEYPDAVISVAEALSIHLREWLISGRLDMAIVFDPPPSALLSYEVLAREPLVLVSDKTLPHRVGLVEVASRTLVMPSKPNALRQLLEQEAHACGLSLRVVAEVDAVRTVLNLVARGVASTVMPVSGLQHTEQAAHLHTARIQAPIIRNRVVLAIARSRPATPLGRLTASLLRKLAARHYGS